MAPISAKRLDWEAIVGGGTGRWVCVGSRWRGTRTLTTPFPERKSMALSMSIPHKHTATHHPRQHHGINIHVPQGPAQRYEWHALRLWGRAMHDNVRAIHGTSTDTAQDVLREITPTLLNSSGGCELRPRVDGPPRTPQPNGPEFSENAVEEQCSGRFSCGTNGAGPRNSTLCWKSRRRAMLHGSDLESPGTDPSFRQAQPDPVPKTLCHSRNKDPGPSGAQPSIHSGCGFTGGGLG